jgi:hypothetical protein
VLVLLVLLTVRRAPAASPGAGSTVGAA